MIFYVGSRLSAGLCLFQKNDLVRLVLGQIPKQVPGLAEVDREQSPDSFSYVQTRESEFTCVSFAPAYPPNLW